MRTKLRRFTRPVFGSLRLLVLPLGVFLTSLALTGLAWSYVKRDVQTQADVRFKETVTARQDAIERRTDAYLDAILGGRALFMASESVGRNEWSKYVHSLEAEQRFQGLQTLSYTERITPGERRRFSREAARQGLPSLQPDLSPGGERPAYFPVVYAAPVDAVSRTLLNHDFYTEADHRATMNRARDTGEATATRMDYVMADSEVGPEGRLALRKGFYVYLPLYRQREAPHETTAERRRALQGFVMGSFVMNDLLRDISPEILRPTIDFEVYDGREVAHGQKLYDNEGVTRGASDQQRPMLTTTRRIEVGGRTWSLYFATLPKFESSVESRLPVLVLVNGLAVSLMLFGITAMLVRSRVRAELASRDLEDANRELEATNRELESFSYSVSHDLRAPLRSIDGFSQILLEDYEDRIDEEGRDYLGRVRAASQHMGQLIDDLLTLSRVTRSALRREQVELSVLAEDAAARLREENPERGVEFVAAQGLVARGDVRLLRVALENLIGNAWKFTSKKPDARIEFGVRQDAGPGARFPTYFVRDNGAGFDMAYAGKLFGAFQRLHDPAEFEGTGIGLATVQRIIHRHGGSIWAEGEAGKGATFYFTLGGPPRSPVSLSPTKTEGKDSERHSKRRFRHRSRTAPGAGP